MGLFGRKITGKNARRAEDKHEDAQRLGYRTETRKKRLRGMHDANVDDYENKYGDWYVCL